MRTWAEARADCINQGGDLVSITDPYEQAFIQGGTIFTPKFTFDLLTIPFIIFKHSSSF